VASHDLSAPARAGGNAGPADSSDTPIDPDAIFASIGEVPYDWQVGADRLVWGAHAANVLPVADPAMLASGRAFAQFLGQPAPRSTL